MALVALDGIECICYCLAGPGHLLGLQHGDISQDSRRHLALNHFIRRWRWEQRVRLLEGPNSVLRH